MDEVGLQEELRMEDADLLSYSRELIRNTMAKSNIASGDGPTVLTEASFLAAVARCRKQLLSVQKARFRKMMQSCKQHTDMR